MESVENKNTTPPRSDPYESIRTDVYVILAALLAGPPSEGHLNVLRNMDWDEDISEKMNKALDALRSASRDYNPSAVRDEYDRIFVGLGCGEIIPYASWYRERAIQSLQLVSLRSDLFRLGIVRQADNRDSEDHAGALCEIMALISQKPDNKSYETQAGFFERHVASWMTAFFKDVESANSARFYCAVGSLGCCFLECEKEYLKYGADAQAHTERRRS
jgi:TorA maturation chaperone TorD